MPLSLLVLTLASCTALRGPAFAAPALGDTFSWDFLNRAPERTSKAESKLLPQVPPSPASRPIAPHVASKRDRSCERIVEMESYVGAGR